MGGTGIWCGETVSVKRWNRGGAQTYGGGDSESREMGAQTYGGGYSECREMGAQTYGGGRQ